VPDAPCVFSTDFVQMKGRGTRKFTFSYIQKEGGVKESIKAAKTKYKLFDFFAVCEYFEEKFNYDEVLKLPPPVNIKHRAAAKVTAMMSRPSLSPTH